MKTTQLSQDRHAEAIPGTSSTGAKVGKFALVVCTGIAPYLLYCLGSLLCRAVRSGFYELYNRGDIQVLDENSNSDHIYLAQRVNSMRLLGTSLTAYMRDQLHDSETHEMPTYLNPEQINIPDDKSVIIPLVFKGDLLRRNHITMLVIDRSEHTIKFIDPKGRRLHEYKDSEVFVNDMQNASMKTDAYWQTLVTKLGNLDEWRIEENTTRVQKDGYNCGVHFYANVLREMNKNVGVEGPIDSIAKVRDVRAHLLTKI